MAHSPRRRLFTAAAYLALAACSASGSNFGPKASNDTAFDAALSTAANPSSTTPSTASPSTAIRVRSTPGASPTARGTASQSTVPAKASTRPAASTKKAKPAAGVLPSYITGVSWNTHVSCHPVITTLSKVLGTQKSALGGATYAGGGFKPGIPDRRSITPPCSVSGVPTLVELHRVTVGSCAKINNDGDWTCELTDPSLLTSVTADFRAIHIEIDGNFRAKGWAPATPPGGKFIDIQGFVFWDPGHTTALFHHHTGWEFHTFTAWRLSA